MESPTTTRTLTVNAAFFQEIKEVDQELWRLLEELRNWSADPLAVAAQRRSFVARLRDLCDQLALHFALEEAYGYFEDPVEVAPRLCEQACALRAEHQQLYLQVSQLAERGEELLQQRERGSAFVPELIAAFVSFDDQLQRHEARENALIQQEYGDDLGVGD